MATLNWTGIIIGLVTSVYARDEEKISRAEAKACKIEETSEIHNVDKRNSSRLSLGTETEKSIGALPKRPRNVHILPERCIICRRDASWFQMEKVNYCYYRLVQMFYETC